MAVPQYSSNSSDVDENWLMQVKNVVSRKDLSKTIHSFLPYLQMKPCGVRHKSRIFSSKHGNTAMHFLRPSLFRVVTALVTLLETEDWLTQTRSCLSCFAVMWPMKFVRLW